MMKRCRSILAAVLSIAVCLAGKPADATNAPPKVKLREKVSITLETQPPVSPQEAQRIKQLIQDLKKIDHPYSGLSSTFSGSSFAPVAGSERVGGIPFNPWQCQDFGDRCRVG
jgi:hypothetical protein